MDLDWPALTRILMVAIGVAFAATVILSAALVVSLRRARPATLGQWGLLADLRPTRQHAALVLVFVFIGATPDRRLNRLALAVRLALIALIFAVISRALVVVLQALAAHIPDALTLEKG